jgi:hypothetical protein
MLLLTSLPILPAASTTHTLDCSKDTSIPASYRIGCLPKLRCLGPMLGADPQQSGPHFIILSGDSRFRLTLRRRAITPSRVGPVCHEGNGRACGGRGIRSYPPALRAIEPIAATPGADPGQPISFSPVAWGATASSAPCRGVKPARQDRDPHVRRALHHARELADSRNTRARRRPCTW